MLNVIFRFILTANATSWMVVIYGIKEQWSFWVIPDWGTGLALLLIPIVLSLVSIAMSGSFGRDGMRSCQECVLADHEFLPVYLGYFFVALSINNCMTLCFVYAIVFVFTFLTQTQYFNPIFLLFGYHFYHITTEQGTKAFLIAKGKVIRNAKDVEFTDLRRINGTTYISRKDEGK